MPWVIGGAALVLYLASLNHWVTLSSLAVVNETCGPRWYPRLFQPLFYLLTWPVHWLPPTWAPLALNLFAALCAALSLVLLARSVALLPQDRLEQQRLLVRHPQGLLSLASAWVPPALAAVSLGLQLTFWENATAASVAMFDLLLFAVIVWCLLEFRLDQRRGWLYAAALVCGLALANTWTMAGFVPLLAVAVMRSKRLHFFRLRFLKHVNTADWRQAARELRADGVFLGRLALFGLAGLSLLFLLPLLQSFSPDSHVGFWPAALGVLRSHKTNLVLLVRSLWWQREAALLLAAVALAPVLLLSIRWHSYTGRERPRFLFLVSLTFYSAHALMLLAGLAVCFDPPFGPRQLSRELRLSLPFLGLSYLTALSIGYYAGFFLLVFSGPIGRRAPFRRAVRWTAPKAVYVLLPLTLVGLLWKNASVLGLLNGPQLRHCADLMIGSLPAEGAVVLSSDPARLALLDLALPRADLAARYTLVDGIALYQAPYRAWLRRHCARPWPAEEVPPKAPAPGRSASPADVPLDEPAYLRFIGRLALSNRLCSLEPGFLGLPETCAVQPHGLVYELKPYPSRAMSGPPLGPGELAGGQAFWEHVIAAEVDPLVRRIAEIERPPPGSAQRFLQWARVPRPVPGALRALTFWYSGALNSWGVALQRQDRWPAARPCFIKALELNPDNLPAQVNLQCNTALVAGQPRGLLPAPFIEERLSQFRSWNRVLASDGPFDDPSYCYQLGLASVQDRLWRLAAQQLTRAQQLAPKETGIGLSLGSLFNACGLPDQALQVAARLRGDPGLQPLDPKAQTEIAFIEAEAWLAKTNPAQAAGILQALLDAHPGDSALVGRTKLAFTLHGYYTNALRLADQQLQDTPNNASVLLEKGLLHLLEDDSSNAIQVLSHVLSLTNSYAGRINRARAYLRAEQWDAAQADYQELLRSFPASYQPYFGLAEVARAKGDTNGAIRYYKQYLAKAPTNYAEYRAVSDRLSSLQPANKF